MTFALQDAKLWDYIMTSAKRRSELKNTKDNDKDKKERIYQRWKKIRDSDLDLQKTAVKISRMCTDTVKNKFLTIKNSTEWESKNFWDWVKRRYTLQNFTSKWNALDKLHQIRHSECKNVTENMSRIEDASAEINNLKISISETVVIYALNNLISYFWPYLASLSHEVWENKKLPTISELMKTLEDEKNVSFKSW